MSLSFKQAHSLSNVVRIPVNNDGKVRIAASDKCTIGYSTVNYLEVHASRPEVSSSKQQFIDRPWTRPLPVPRRQQICASVRLSCQ